MQTSFKFHLLASLNTATDILSLRELYSKVHHVITSYYHPFIISPTFRIVPSMLTLLQDDLLWC